jgi:alkanesulfonate monooxygenase
MSKSKQLKLGAFMRPVSIHTGAWRYPGALPDANFNFPALKKFIQKLEQGKFSIKILPGALVVVGETVAEAYAKRIHLDSLVHYDSGIASLNSALGYDVSGFDPDGYLPEIPPTNAGKSSRERVIAIAQRENLTIRQLAQRIGSYGGLAFVGTPQSIADEMEQWLIEEGSDGFNIMFPFLPEGLNDFVDKVIPELQQRGIFRQEYEGKTLRENLGLARPVNRFFQPSFKIGI